VAHEDDDAPAESLVRGRLRLVRPGPDSAPATVGHDPPDLGPAIGIVSAGDRIGVGAFWDGNLGAVGYPPQDQATAILGLRAAVGTLPAVQTGPRSPLLSLTGARAYQRGPLLGWVARDDLSEMAETGMTVFHLLEVTAEEYPRLVKVLVAGVAAATMVDAQSITLLVRAIHPG
jgi:hypothetical protein